MGLKMHDEGVSLDGMDRLVNMINHAEMVFRLSSILFFHVPGNF